MGSKKSFIFVLFSCVMFYDRLAVSLFTLKAAYDRFSLPLISQFFSHPALTAFPICFDPILI